MTPKGVLKAIGKALLYFAIYFGWQLIVINWISIAASVYLSLTMDPAELLGSSAISNPEQMTVAEYQTYSERLTLALTEKIYEIINRFSVHLTLLSGILTLVTLFVIFKARGKSLIRDVKITRLKPSQGITLFTLGAALNVFVSLVMSIIPFPATWMDQYIESSSALIEGNIVIILLTTVVAAPLVEEIVFRGLCYTRLKQGLPMLAAMLISAWGFGLVHGTIVWFIYASIFGFLLAWVYEKYRSLSASILMHFGFNLFGQLSSLVTEMSDAAYWLLLISGGIASAALIIHIQRTSEYKIELGMAEDEK